jgi:ornithine carbamoyltransferase
MTIPSPGADFLRVCDRSGSQLDSLLSAASDFKFRFEHRAQSAELQDRRVAFIWDGEGFRNRVAFELGILAMGGLGVEIPGTLGEREAVADLAAYLDNWFDIIVARTPSYEALTRLATAASAPVVNARTWHNHPCEILGDLAFAQAAGKDLSSLKVVFVGEATNLLHSWCEAAAVLPIQLTQVCPPGYEVDRRWLDGLVPRLAGRVATSTDLECSADADIIYTDCWPLRSGLEQQKEVRAAFETLQIDAGVLSVARPDVLFLPCPPVTRGEEVSAEALDSPKCRVVEAKDWLLSAQNALLAQTVLAV